MFGETKYATKTWSIGAALVFGVFVSSIYVVSEWKQWDTRVAAICSQQLEQVAMPETPHTTASTPLTTGTSNKPNKVIDVSTASQLLLHTYGRTGSTFTSAIISHHPDVFYIPEPLHRMPEGTDVYERPVSDLTHRTAMDIVRGYLSCDMLTVDTAVYTSVVMHISNSTTHLRKCLAKIHRSPLFYIQCFLEMWRQCNEKPTRYVKTIRMRFSWYEELLQLFPNFKLIYLIRDPRATLYSQADKFETFTMQKNSKERATSLCNDISSDIRLYRKFSKKYPGRLLAIRYEDGAMKPLDFAKELYRFGDLNPPVDMGTFISGITHSKMKMRKYRISADPNYGFEKGDSLEAMNHWRRKASFDIVKTVDDACQYLYPQLGYKVARSNQHLNSSESLVVDPNRDSIFHVFKS